MEEKGIQVSLVIPAYNEEKVITKTIDTALSYFLKQNYKFELIIVDDGSSDKTVGLVKAFLNKHESVKLVINDCNRGKGFSVRRGALLASGKYIVFSDADMSTPIEEISNLMHFLSAGYNIVIGSRAMKSSRIVVKQPWFRQLMGKVFNIFTKLLLAVDIQDTQCGFKGFEYICAKRIFAMQKISGFSFDVEVLYLAKLLMCKVKEMPITWKNRDDSRVRLLKDSLNMAFDVFRIKINSLKGIYQCAPV